MGKKTIHIELNNIDDRMTIRNLIELWIANVIRSVDKISSTEFLMSKIELCNHSDYIYNKDNTLASYGIGEGAIFSVITSLSY